MDVPFLFSGFKNDEFGEIALPIVWYYLYAAAILLEFYWFYSFIICRIAISDDAHHGLSKAWCCIKNRTNDDQHIDSGLEISEISYETVDHRSIGVQNDSNGRSDKMMQTDILISKSPCDPKLQFNNVPYSYGESVKKVVSDYTAFISVVSVLTK